MTKLYEHIFSLKNSGEHKILRILGCKFSLKRKKVKFSQIKKSDLKIAFYVGCDDNRSSRYRVDNLVEGLTKNGIIADRYYQTSLDILEKRNDYDLLVLFRSGEFDKKYYNQIKEIVKNLKYKNIPVIYDIDDLLIQSKNIDTAQKVNELSKYANAVTVTTKTLADFYKEVNSNVFVIKNTINYEQYFLAENLNKIHKNNGKIKIVYQCGSEWHDEDFRVCSNAILEILEKYKNVEFHLIGPLKYDSKFLKYKEQFKKIKYFNYKDLLKYVSNMDINIAPLAINDFNNCKSELKIFESALVKIPTIASSIEPYKAIIEQGHNGFIANSKDEWIKYLSELIENKELRKTIGENAYNEIVPQFYIENEINNIISIYKQIIERKNCEKF